MALTVAVTGPTGQIGTAAVMALERDPAVERIHGMARRPFDPASMGCLKTTYRQGDILDRGAVDARGHKGFRRSAGVFGVRRGALAIW